jgi:anti-anti-sigma factor
MPIIKIEEHGNYKVLNLEGDFVASDDINDLRSNLKELSSQEKNFVITNLANTNFLSSAALGVLLSANAMFEKHNGKLILANMSDYIRNLFSITKLDMIFEIFPSIYDAVKSLEKSKKE